MNMKRWLIVLLLLFGMLGLSSCSKGLPASTDIQPSNSDTRYQAIHTKISKFLNDYMNMVYNDELTTDEKIWLEISTEGANVKRYKNGDDVIRYELDVCRETGKNIINIDLLDNEGYYIIELVETYDFSIPHMKSVIDYQLKKYVLLSGQLYLYDEDRQSLTPQEDESSYVKLIAEAEALFV